MEIGSPAVRVPLTLFDLCPDKGAAEQVVVSGILPILALSLRHRGSLTQLTARLVSELAKECKFPLCLYFGPFVS